MTFHLDQPTKVRLHDIDVLSQKNRQADESPGVQLFIHAELPNHVLTTFDGRLKGVLFDKGPGSAVKVANKSKDNQTGTLDGVEPVSDLTKLTGIGKAIKTMTWAQEVTGGEMDLSFATSKLKLDDCRAHTFRIQPKEGGTVMLKFKVDAPNASETVFAKLAKFKSRELEITFEQHVVDDAQRDIEDKVPAKKATPAPAAKKPAPPKRATKPLIPEKALANAFKTPPKKAGPKVTVKKTRGVAAPASAAKPMKALSPEAAWPFPKQQH